MPTARQESIARLATDQRPLPEGEPFTVRFLQPEDAPGVARLFYTVYGDGYPIDTYYLPERITAVNASREVCSVVARTESGAVVSHIALYRSSPSNPNLYEYGLGLTLPAYRSTLAFARCNSLLLSLLGSDGIDGLFGEAVCNHVTTQKLMRPSGAVETALEPALMPARAYRAEQSAPGRVGCIMAFKVARDQRRPLCIPACYRSQLDFLMAGTMLDRQEIVPDLQLTGGAARLETVRFPEAGVARCSITAPGEDLAEQLRLLEQELKQEAYAVLQCFVPLGAAWGGAVVEQLRRSGLFLGGFLPAWFGDDGLLMQKLWVDPDFASLQLHSARAKQIRELVQADRLRAQSFTD